MSRVMLGIYKLLSSFLHWVHLFFYYLFSVFGNFLTAPLFSRSFWSYLLFASLSCLVISLHFSAALKCFHGVQIVMSANINQIINKNQFFCFDQNINTSLNHWISANPCWVFGILLTAILQFLLFLYKHIFFCLPSIVFCYSHHKIIILLKKY